MTYRYFLCDVFTDTRFGGNQLAVLPEAEGLSDRQMQQIAREFNFSESTFVLPAEAGQTRRVRIFTPTAEVPFAGHPNVGTAFVLASRGDFGEIGAPVTVTFEEKAGLVPVTIRQDPGRPIWCELAAPQSLSLGTAISAEALAAAVSLTADDVVTGTHPPQVASVGLPFLIAEVRNRAALERARANMTGLDAFVAAGVTPDVHLYTRSADEFDLRARMFAPLDGVPEDPATGSANCALAALLSHYDAAADGSFRWRIAQGVEMGRPSVLEARTEKRAGVVVAIHIGGFCVLMSEGRIEVD
ncbi:MAG TPA: PhzF family phenazine biosynthesis protein [Thermoanaerobaculia bacterium]|jgi:trans-2,3-dihydro-3-hydroxyanthranilate isomerase|nr:PhzF family phenazine biosynthesis protein [Thermoanaerobaculia bacterium]